MADSYSVKAILSAQDKSFSSVFGKASSVASSLRDTLASGLGFGILSSIGSKAVDAVSSGISGMIGDLNESSAAWKTFQSTMEMNGHAKKEIKSVKKELQDFAQKTIYSSSDMASTFAQLDAVGTKHTKDLVKGFGGLAAAAENPQQAMKTLSQQATQMAAKPKVAWEDFKLMVEQTPAGIAAVAKYMGLSTQEMIAAVQDGKIATEDFFEAIAEVGTNADFSKLATEYKTIGQAMDGLTETVSNKLAPAFDVVSDAGIGAVSAITDALDSLDGSAIAGKVQTFMDTAGKYWAAIQEDVSAVGAAFGEALSAISSGLGELSGAFGSAESIQSFSDVIGTAAGALTAFAGFLKNHADVIAKVIARLPQLLAAYKGFQIVKALAPGIGAFSGAVLKLAGGGIGGIAAKLFGVAAGETAAGKAGKTSAKQMLTAAQSFALMGMAVLAVSAGFALLAQSSISLANAGPLAIGVMAGLIGAVAALGAGMTIMLNSIKPGPAKLKAISVAMLSMGAAVVLTAAGFALLSYSAMSLANAGPLAIGVMAGMVVSLAGLAAGAAAIGPALTAGAVGLMAFGAAMVLTGVGALLAAAALDIVANALPLMADCGLSGALSITALGASMVVLSAGAALAGVGMGVLGAGLLVVGAAALAASVGVLSLAAGSLVLGTGLALAAASVTVLSAAFPLVATGAAASSVALMAFSAAATSMSGLLMMATASVTTFGVVIGASSAGMIVFAGAMVTAGAGALVMAAALSGVNSSMTSIARGAKSAECSIGSMESSVDVVQSGLNHLKSVADHAIEGLTGAFENGAAQAKRSGKQMGDSMQAGVKSGVNQLPAIATQSMTKFNSALNAGGTKAVSVSRKTSSAIVSALRATYGKTYSAGAYIGKGLANGLRSQLGAVRSVAAQLAAAAEKAIRTKAKIHSPSKVAGKLGVDWGKGYVNGLWSMGKDAWSAAEALVSMPALASGPRMSYVGGLSEEYEYTRNAQYTIIVPVEYDGREVARVTAPYTEAELDKRQTRSQRKQGIR